MGLFQQKKSRSKPALKEPTLTKRIEGYLEDQRTLPRLIAVAVFIAAMLLVLQSWEAPFPYRIGDRFDHGLTARVPFKVIDEFASTQKRLELIRQVPAVFRNDPDPLENLPAKLRADLEVIAQVDGLEELPDELRTSFGLFEALVTEGELGPQERFQRLQEAIGAMQGGSGAQIGQLILQFENFLSPLDRYGLVDPQELSRNRIDTNQTLAIVRGDGEDRQRAIVAPSEVLITEVVKETGRLGSTWANYPDLQRIQDSIADWLVVQAPTTLQFDGDATAAARERAAENAFGVYESYNRGRLLLEPGRVIDEPVLDVLRAEARTINEQMTIFQKSLRVVTVTVMLIVIVALNGYFLSRFQPDVFGSTKRLAVYLATLAFAIGLARLLSADPWRAEVLPILTVVMVFTVAYNQIFAAIAALTICLIVTVSTTGDLTQLVTLISVCATAIIPLSTVHSRSTLIKVGAMCGVVYMLVSLGTTLLESQTVSDIWANWFTLSHSLWGLFKCLVAGYLVAGTLPFIESLFGVITDISLLELGDRSSHPLIRELIRNAPGTFNHSEAVARIGERAALEIGANGLLLRAAAYFHDVGKMLKPYYFIENIGHGKENKHEQLAPAMSTLIIIGHVKDGVDLARQYDLPQQIIDFIEQHHGTTLVEYFYRKAITKAEGQPDHKTEVEESSFRYPGPKPQTKEAGVMMLTDAVESASRTLSEPTPKRIENLVHSLAMKRLMDGQFDESPLTLSEIRIVEQSLVRSLISAYHGRIKYPSEEEEKEKTPGEQAG